MNIYVSILAIITLIYWCVVLGNVFRGMYTVRSLAQYILPPGTALPTLSIIVAARNEKDRIGEALKSLIATEYPNKEIIVVDDRSTDGTGILLHNVVAGCAECKVVEIKSLPEGWLGKNHALFSG
jgi:cellulose synthase/poly-beta-1,6-N-acetylglucosamine synthase-like glycosyltransferase